MKKTLKETLMYLFEAEEKFGSNAPAGTHKINDELYIQATPRVEGNFASFSLNRKKGQEETSVSSSTSLTKKQESLRIKKDNEDISISKEDMKKIMSFIVGYLRKYRIKEATISLGRSKDGIAGLFSFRKYFEKNGEYYETKGEKAENREFLLHIRKGKKGKRYYTPDGELRPKKEPRAKKERDPEEVEAEKEERDTVGVKRVHKIEKDENGEVVKTHYKLFPRGATVKKLIYTLKRKEGGTVDIYNYSTRREAGLLKKKLTYRERIHRDELSDMDKVRTTPDVVARNRNQDYENLKRSIRSDVMYQLNLAKKVEGRLPEEVEKAVRSSINLSVGKFDVVTDWHGYDEDNKDSIARKVARDVRYRFKKYF